MNKNRNRYQQKGEKRMKLSPAFTFIATIAVSLLALTNSTGAVEMKKAPIDTIFPQGEPNPYGKFFTGQTYLSLLSAKDNVFNAPLANVTFEPGARTLSLIHISEPTRPY